MGSESSQDVLPEETDEEATVVAGSRLDALEVRDGEEAGIRFQDGEGAALEADLELEDGVRGGQLGQRDLVGSHPHAALALAFRLSLRHPGPTIAC